MSDPVFGKYPSQGLVSTGECGNSMCAVGLHGALVATFPWASAWHGVEQKSPPQIPQDRSL
jgi:hypothetical protein